MKHASRLNLNNVLFSLFWWVIQKISPKRGERLLYWGLESGAFPNQSREDAILGVDLFGLHFNTPIGIGSGFSHRISVIDDLIFMGAGFGEFGPYTLEAEDPVTETFFLRRDKAFLVQSLGYKNAGISAAVPALTNRRYLPNIVGVNISITADSEGENVKQGRIMSFAEEFDLMTRKVAPYCDYITVDFSHPETELFRVISDGATVVPLLQVIKNAAKESAPVHPPRIFVKIPLNVTQMEVPMICHHLMAAGVDAVIVGGGVSLAHEHVRLSKRHYAGILSGAPVKRYVIDTITKVHQFTKGQLPIIACGGVFNGQDAFDCLAAGASLIQIGTVLRFEGPKAVTRINRELALILRQKEMKSVRDAVGSDFD